MIKILIKGSLDKVAEYCDMRWARLLRYARMKWKLVKHCCKYTSSMVNVCGLGIFSIRSKMN